jgi:hypothetical protein
MARAVENLATGAVLLGVAYRTRRVADVHRAPALPRVPRDHPVIVLAIEDGTLIRWRGRPGVPGMLDGEHELRLRATADGGTRSSAEVFTGLLFASARQVLDDTERGSPT